MIFYHGNKDEVGDVKKLGKEKGKTKIIIYIVAIIIVSIIVASVFLDDN